MVFSNKDIHTLLNQKVEQYNTINFIAEDPIAIPHRFSRRSDIEIAGFFAATIAWGNRLSVLKSANTLMALMDNEPTDFVRSATDTDLKAIQPFVHRTFNSDDAIFFIRALRTIYTQHPSLETIVVQGIQQAETLKNDALSGIWSGIEALRQALFSGTVLYQNRTQKHFPKVTKGAAAKRINMYLRWMVRRDTRGVDFGLWQLIDPAWLICPLDVHTARTARILGILHRKQDDRAAAEELTAYLRTLDPNDPVKYDFALFGLSRYDKIQ